MHNNNFEQPNGFNTLNNSLGQNGSTLISLLIGMLISLLCISGSLALYKNLVRVAADTHSDATYDGQLALAMLTARLELQNAGFGIPGPGTSHIAAQATGTSSSLFWRYKIGNQYFCKGLQDIAVGTNRELRLIESSAAACTETAALTSLAYTTSQTLGEFKNLANPVVSFAISQQSCWPYGVGKVAPHSQVVISANSAAKQFNSAIANSSYTYCLPNIYPT